MQAGKKNDNEKKYQEIMLSIQVKKRVEREDIERNRVLVITNETLNLMRRNSINSELVLKRRIGFRDMSGITKCLSNTEELLIHVRPSHDLRL